MDTLLGLINQLTDNPEQMRLLFLFMVGSAVFLLGVAVIMIINNRSDPLQRRLREVRRVSPDAPPMVGGGGAGERIGQALEPYSGLILPGKESERSKVAQQLIIAGYRSPSALNVYYAIKTIGALVPPLIVLLVAPTFPDMTTGKMTFYAILAAFIGVIMPNIVLERKVRRRQRRLRHAFPDALDLLVVCIEAGLGLNAALQRVARELDTSYPELAEELKLVNAEIRAGVGRVDALKNLSIRTGLDDIRGLVSLLIQSLRFGGSVAETLRVYAEEFRDKRMQQAEEMAAKIGTKMIFPLIFCLFPSFFLVAIGPAVIRLIDAFEHLAR